MRFQVRHVLLDPLRPPPPTQFVVMLFLLALLLCWIQFHLLIHLLTLQLSRTQRVQTRSTSSLPVISPMVALRMRMKTWPVRKLWLVAMKRWLR